MPGWTAVTCLMISSSTAGKSFSQDRHVGQVDEADGPAQLRFVEERKLLLITQHFHGRFAQDSEIECGLLLRRIGENDLMCEGGLAAARRARDDVERKFRDAAAQNVIQSAHPGRDLMDRDFGRVTHGFFGPLARIIFCFHIRLLS